MGTASLPPHVIPQGQAASPTLPYRLSSERVRFTQLVLYSWLTPLLHPAVCLIWCVVTGASRAHTCPGW